MTPRRVLEEGEERNGYGVWKDDLYGVGEILGRKREKRGWNKGSVHEVERSYLGGNGNEESDEMVRLLLRWKGEEDGKTLFPGKLPWNRLGDGTSFETM